MGVYCVFLLFAMLNIVTVNVQGLRDKQKRLDTFQTLRNGNFDVVALQETHCDYNSIGTWKGEWGGESEWTHYKSDQAGVAILFSSKLSVNVLRTSSCNRGRIIAVTAEIDSCIFQFVNVYGPNPTGETESAQFFTQIENIMDQSIQPVIFGDFNMVENLKMDRRGGKPCKRHTYGLGIIKNLREGFDLVDVWRSQHPHAKEFTWHSPDGQIHSRLDRIYIPRHYLRLVKGSSHEHFVWADHDVCRVNMLLPSANKARGVGYWKLNVQYLSHTRYKEKIEAFWEDWQTKKQDYGGDLSLWWDCGKIYIKSITIQYAQELYSLRKSQKYALMDSLKEEKGKQIVDRIKITELEEKLLKMERDVNDKVFAHTHTSIREACEEPTKYFYDLLRVRQNQVTMDSLKKDDGSVVTDQQEMMAEAKQFYDRLFTREEHVSLEDQEFFLQKINKSLTQEQRDNLDTAIGLEELRLALFDTKKNKTPGYDGLPYEFYQTFWHVLGRDFLQVVGYSLNMAKCLPYSQTTSIVTLVYKKNDKQLLKNWRPISLLCCDYKILSKTIANRIKRVLDCLLSQRQTCSVPGRTIFQNLHFMRDAIFFCDVNKIKGYILSIDQEKAFDRLNREFLLKVLKKMGFGENFVSWVEVLFRDSIGRILLNGYISVDFDITRGVRQGCSLSAYVYASYIEALDLAIAEDPSIIGITIPGPTGPKTILYADDINLILSDRTAIANVFSLLARFERATGSRINPEKTEGLALNQPDLSHPDFAQINWKINEGIEILGIVFYKNQQDTIDRNWGALIRQMESDTRRHRFRNLSLKGRVLVLNMLVLSKAWYPGTVLPLPDDKAADMERVALEFLWHGGTSNPIGRDTIYQLRDKGGLALKSPRMMQKALQLKFMKDILTVGNRSSWLQFPRYWIGLRLSAQDPRWNFLGQYPRLNTITTPHKSNPVYDLLLESFRAFQLADLPDMKDWTTSMFYFKFLEREEHQPYSYISFWSEHRVDPVRMWKHVHVSYALGVHQDVHFKFLHRVLPSNAYMKTRFRGRGFRNINVACPSCPNGNVETTEHIFLRCVAARPILDFIYPSVQALVRNQPFRIFNLILNDFPAGVPGKVPRMVITLIQITMYVIWFNRNRKKFHNEVISLEQSKNSITKHFKSVIEFKFRKHLPHRLAKFRENYCHTPAICDVVNNDELVINLL